MNPVVPAGASAAALRPVPRTGGAAGPWRGLRALFAPAPAPRLLTTAQLINQQ